jgi:hypothetical protein
MHTTTVKFIIPLTACEAVPRGSSTGRPRLRKAYQVEAVIDRDHPDGTVRYYGTHANGTPITDWWWSKDPALGEWRRLALRRVRAAHRAAAVA